VVGGMTVCLYVFPPLLKEFRRHHPDVEVKVTPAATPRLVRQLRTGAADLGLVTLPVEGSSLVVEPVIREELLVVTSPQHPLARRKKSVTPEDLASQPFVLFEAGSNSRRTIEAFFSREQIVPKVVTETENVEIIKALVRVKLGISIVPYQAVAREVHAGQLFCARIAGRRLFRETGWVYVRSGHPSRTVVEMRRIFDQIRPRLRLLPEASVVER
jgi:DNA-binding transcriptional LysR family regulator